MKNLEVWEVSVKNINIKPKEHFHLCYSYDADNKGKLFIASHNLQVLNLDDFGAIIWSKDISEITNRGSFPVNLSYILLPNQLCVALSNGELITIDDTGTNCDLVGVFENGLLAMEWSPDQDLLVLVTKDLKIITMSCTFDPINEVELLGEDFGEKEFMNVGWGKKETQFHGSAGKQAAKAQKEDSGLFVNSDLSIKVTWRGDGLFFAVGFQMNGMRRFKVLDREGNLQYTSEKQLGLESNLSWRPSGNLIATTQKLPDRYVVSFFEKNGLKHGEFAIPVNSATTVEDLFWSSDSEILTLQCRNLEDNTQKVLLFTTSNYHWYLKQSLVFHNTEKINQIFWDNDFDVVNNKKLHVFLQNGKHYTYSWIWNVNHSRGKCSQDNAVVAVTHGQKVLVTGLRQTVIPPPMASLELEVESDIHSIQFAPPYMQTDQSSDTNTFFITTEKKLVFFELTQKFPLQYKLVKSLDIDTYNFPFQYYNWYWLKHDTILAIKVDESNCYHLVEYNIANNVLSQRLIIPLPSAVVRLHCHPSDPSILFLQSISGDIMEYSVGQNVVVKDISFNVPCPKFDVLSIKSNLQFLGLSHKGNLYMNNNMIMNNVSSYFIHTSFLLITTLKHLLLCAELTESGLEAIIEYQKKNSSQVYKRKIERGAKLIIAVPNATNTIFQMVRGNLETIQPQPLSLKIIGELLDSLEYEKAFDLMRKQRINLNLIHDHNPKLFLNNIDKFLNSIKNTSWLCLFLSDLENSDVTKTMYCSSYIKGLNEENNTKVHEIYNIIQKNIEKRIDSRDKILPLLTTYIKKNTVEDLENALLLIKRIKIEESGGHKLPVGSDEAIKFLLYMVDVNQLFNVTLGMYDFDLVLFVANKSQKDPKEYLPMLNELNGMDENYKKFTINKHLKRFDKAVKYLRNCGIEKYDELKTFVKYHSLYSEALALFFTDEDIYKQISNDFGLHLKLQKHFIEAGIVYEKAKNYISAVECYKDALEWELALSLAQHLSKEQYEELCRDLVNGLKDEKRHKEALIILQQYLQSKEDAIYYAIESGQYKTALKLCSIYNRPDLRDGRLLPAILEEYQNLQELIDKNLNSFIKYRTRLYEVREKKQKDQVENIYDSFNANKDNDLYSDSGSTLASSSGSGKSYRSSKNIRKHQRKVASLKEGSQYEDVALIMTLHSLVTSSSNLRLQVKDINIALNFFNKDKMASLLQNNLDKLLNDMKDSFKAIWTNDLVLQATKAAIDAENLPEGSNILADSLSFLEPHVRIAPIIQDVSWKLEGFS